MAKSKGKRKAKGKDLTTDYVVLSPKGESEDWKAGAFWKMAFNPKHPKNKRNMGYLVSAYEFEEDWASWECHPNGDEFVYCAEGALTFHLEKKTGVEKISLKAGEFLIVPKNTWHTASVKKPCKMVFVTWGFGSKHRDRE